jgi:hypothetical protein
LPGPAPTLSYRYCCLKIIATSIDSIKEVGLGITFVDSYTRVFRFSNVDVSQPLVISITYNTVGTSIPSATFTNLTEIYKCFGGRGDEGELGYFIVGQPTDTTVEVDFTDTGQSTNAILAAYQAVIQ